MTDRRASSSLVLFCLSGFLAGGVCSATGCVETDIEYQDTANAAVRTAGNSGSGASSSGAQLGPPDSTGDTPTGPTQDVAGTSSSASATPQTTSQTTSQTSSQTTSQTSSQTSSSQDAASTTEDTVSSGSASSDTAGSSDASTTGSSGTTSSNPVNTATATTTDSAATTDTATTTTGDATTTDTTETTTTTDDTAASTGPTTTSGSTQSSDTAPDSSTQDSGDQSGDPDAIPTDGIRLTFNTGESTLALRHPRVLVARVSVAPMPLPGAKDPNPKLLQAGEAPSIIGPAYSVQDIARDYPIELDAGAFPVQMPSIPDTAISQSLKRSPLYMVALYDDKNQNKGWDPSDGFIAASPSLFFQMSEKPDGLNPSWHRTPKLEAAPHLSQLATSEKAFITAVRPEKVSPRSSQPLFRFGQAPVEHSYRISKSHGTLDQRVRFIASLSHPETKDLAANFLSEPRLVDLPFSQLTEDPGAQLELTQEHLRTLTPQASEHIAAQGLPLQTPPGLSLTTFVAFPMVGYDRPIGAAQAKPDAYLTADSQVIAYLCGPSSHRRVREVFASAIYAASEQDRQHWFTSPIGALYAAAAQIELGWSLGLIDTYGPDRACIHEASAGRVTLRITPACGPPFRDR